MKKETVADVLPGLLVLTLIVELIVGIPGIVIGATWLGVVISLCIWGWVREAGGHFLLWTLLTVGAIGLFVWLIVILSRAFKRQK